MAVKTITWSVNLGGSNAAGTSGRNFSISGTQIPANAKISKVNIAIGLSVAKPAGSLTRLYHLKTQDGTYFFSGNPIATADTDTYNNHGYYDASLKNGISYDFTGNISYFVGRSSGILIVRVNNNGSGTSYVRGLQLTFTYTDFEPTLVYAGNPIYASDYNQLQAAYPALGVSSGSLITKAQIDAVRNYDTDVVATSVGTVITADYFNNSVLKKI